MQLVADFGGTMLWPMIALSNIAQGSAVLGMIYLLQRKNADRPGRSNVPSCISCYLGVTRAGHVRRQTSSITFPFLCGMIGSAIAGVVCTATFHHRKLRWGVGGLPGILSIQPASMLSFAICYGHRHCDPPFCPFTVIMGKKKGVA